MPKYSGGSPTTIPQTQEKLLCTFPAGLCNGQLYMKFTGAGTLYFKWACEDNEHVTDKDYEDSLAPNEWRIIDSPDPGKVLLYCSSADVTPNLIWHASWSFPR